MCSYGLLGRKLRHSYSPAIHRFFGDYQYCLYEKEPEDIEAFLTQGSWRGLNVTIPYKKTVVPFCSILSPLAQALGSVNTLLRQEDGTICGDNTDAWGFLSMARRLPVDYAGKKALILGSGGASVTVRTILEALGCRVTVVSRSGPIGYEDLPRHADAAVLVNTTPVGMYPNNGESPVDLRLLPKLEAVLDLIYNPVRTRLILDAEARNIPCASGLYMLVAQAARSSEIWTGRKIPGKQVERVWQQIGNSMENLILIGMPGCGKTTVGKALAASLGRPFVDADEELVKQIGDIPAFFRSHGEDAFRAEETALLTRLGTRSGLVLSTGGGCVTRQENYDLLHQNGKILWIRRDLSLLPADGRPVTQRDGAAQLYARRKPLYQAFSDYGFRNDAPPEVIADRIIARLSLQPAPQEETP